MKKITKRAIQRRSVQGIAITAAIVVATIIALPQLGLTHCQVPCGIYDDAARVVRMHEDATTVGKAINRVNSLAGKTDAQSANQLARWVANKESHASKIITTMAEYFFAQRIKPVAAGTDGYDAYLKKLADHHAVIIAAMKAKQNADAKYAEVLHAAIDAVGVYYNVEGHDHK